jgi:hypothetical protein
MMPCDDESVLGSAGQKSGRDRGRMLVVILAAKEGDIELVLVHQESKNVLIGVSLGAHKLRYWITNRMECLKSENWEVSKSSDWASSVGNR